MSPLRAVPAIARKLRQWAFAFLSLCKRRWRVLAAAAVVLVALELVARAYVLRRIAAEAQLRGFEVHVESCFVTPFAVSLRGVSGNGALGRGDFSSVRAEWFPSKRIIVSDGHVHVVRRENGQPSEQHGRGRLADFFVRLERVDVGFEGPDKRGSCSGGRITIDHGDLSWACREVIGLVSGTKIVASELDGALRAGRISINAKRASIALPPSSNSSPEKHAQPAEHFDVKGVLAAAKVARERVRGGLRSLAESGRVRIEDTAIGDLSLGSMGAEWGLSNDISSATPMAANIVFGASHVEARLNEFPIGRVVPKNPHWCVSDSARLTGHLKLGDDDVLSGTVGAHELCVEHARIADVPLQMRPLILEFWVAPNVNGSWRVFASVAQGEAKIVTEFVVSMNANRPALQLELHVPEVRCQLAFEAMPVGAWSRVAGAEVSGTFALDAKLNFELGSKEDPKLDYTVSDQCRFVRVPQDIARDVYRKPFSHRFYAPDGTESIRLAGPGTPEWTAYSRLGKYLPLAVTAMEDATFFRHRGFHHPSLKSALVADLKARAFVRGGSTVTMQLAKNLFLTRKKTLFRKLEEMVLTAYLEQTFSKEELLELYLNLIEFGPNVYGARAAAQYYFGTTPSDLSLGEAFFLISVLPAPVKHSGMRANGTVPEGWVRYLRKAADNLRRVGALELDEVEEAFHEPIGFLGHRKSASDDGPSAP